MSPRFSLTLNHTPWKPERLAAKTRMLCQLLPLSEGVPFFLHDTDYRRRGERDGDVPGNPKPERVDFTLAQWRWAAEQGACTHHVFMTDDLDLAPGFWRILRAMVQAVPEDVIGLLSNHPRAPVVLAEGGRWYRTNSWVVGPCYVVPDVELRKLLAWPGLAAKDAAGMGWSDDSTLNEYITFAGRGQAFHPVPTPIEHSRELVSTWAHTGHGDAFSHERVGWRARPSVEGADYMDRESFWLANGGPAAAPMLTVGG